MGKSWKLIHRLSLWIVTALRVAVGVVVMKTGLDVVTGHGLFMYNTRQGSGTGLFVILIGAYFVFFSLARLWGREKS